MRRLYSILAATILFGTVTPAIRAEVQVSVDFFHDHLESYGDWREVRDYGYCWQPRDVDRDWRPYSDGRWLYTDAGWTWDSEEPYSWAVYHYGRWARVDQVGWVWVPGTEWGPAWVSWRRSPQHVGWAPLPPEARFSRSRGFNAQVDLNFNIGPMNYSFVEVRNFGAPRLRTVFVEPRENISIIHQTTNITRISYVNNVVYNAGPQYDVISRESAQPIRRLKLDRRVQLDGNPRAIEADQLRARVEGDSLRVVALPFNTKPATAPRKVAAKVEKAAVNHGWKDAGTPAEVAKLRTKIKSEPATAAESRPVPPASVPVVDEKPAIGKVRDSSQPARPATTDFPPASRGKPSAPDQPAKPLKPSKGAKPVKPEAANPRPTPLAAEKTAAPTPSKKGKIKGNDSPRPSAEAPPQSQVHERKPKSEKIEPKRKPLPVVVEKPQPRPQARQPEARPKAVPAAAQPQPVQPAKGKSKGKDKDGKKEGTKPDEAAQ